MVRDYNPAASFLDLESAHAKGSQFSPHMPERTHVSSTCWCHFFKEKDFWFMFDPRLWILLCWPTWNSGTVERMSMMMEARRNRELTITNTFRGGVKESLNQHLPITITNIRVSQTHLLHAMHCTICIICDFLPWQPLMSWGPQRVSKWHFSGWHNTFLRMAGAATKSFQRIIINPRPMLTLGAAFANKAQIFITSILLFWEGFSKDNFESFTHARHIHSKSEKIGGVYSLGQRERTLTFRMYG